METYIESEITSPSELLWMNKESQDVLYETDFKSFILPELSENGGDFFADSECPSDRLDEESRQGRCKIWINTVTQQNSGIISRSNSSLTNEEYKLVSDDYSSDSNISTAREWRKTVTDKQKLLCEWKNCMHETTDMDNFQLHVSNHIPQLDKALTNEEYKLVSDDYSSDSNISTARKRRKTVKITDKQKLFCEWKNCMYETTDMDNFQLHVSNHLPQLELHSKDDDEALTNEEYKLVSDDYSSDSNISTARKRRKTVKITDKQKLLCEWKNCTYETTDMDNFQLHVSNHIPQLDEALTNEEYKLVSDDYSSDSNISTARKRRKTVKITDKQKLLCEWKNCTHETTDMDNFQLHVSNHIPQLELRTKDDDEEVYGCLWMLCDFETDNPQEAQRHVNHHAYHTRLKAVGRTISLHWNLPICGYESENRNLLPDLPNPFLCDWLECGKLFNNMQVYKNHIALHLNTYSSTFNTQRCMWKGCKSMFHSKVRLKSHLHVHTKDKVVACSNCGTMLASNSKYYDHCKRQIPVETSAYHCTHCMKSFTTKRLLREHMRSLINHYKCCFCDMTCSNPSVLSAHIRYKHLDAKPFVCVCGFACKTYQDLKTHEMTHSPENQFSCDKEDCDFSCRSKRTLMKHMIDVHQVSESRVYCCHIPGCTKTFKRGAYLTKHLMEKHYLSWPSGHSKFIYRREEDGFYRLQTLRYERLEVTQEAVKPSKETKVSPDFKITRNTESESEVPDFVIEVNQKEDEVTSSHPEVMLTSENEQEPVDDPYKVTDKEILICIEDEQGNILKCSTVKIENKSMPLLPDGAKLIAAGQ